MTQAAVLDHFRVLRYSALNAYADFRSTYTWRTWVGGWLVRVLCQVAFFTLIGRLLGSAEYTRYLLVGNAVMVAAAEALLVVPSTTWERLAGTVPLLVAAPASPVVVFFGRSVQWLPSGTASATISLFALAPLFGVRLPMPTSLLVVPLIGLVALATYCLGLVLGGLVLRAGGMRNLVSNLTMFVLMVITGVQVPVAFWPEPVQWAAGLLPVTHGLAAVRGVLTGLPSAKVVGLAALELAIAIGWLLVAVCAFHRFAESGRRSGSIEFDE